MTRRRLRSTLAGALGVSLLLGGAPVARPQTEDPLRELWRQLKDPDAVVRAEAAYSIARIGPAAGAAAPWLAGALRDEDAIVRQAAARALGEIGPAARAGVVRLLLVQREHGAHLPMVAAARRLTDAPMLTA